MSSVTKPIMLNETGEQIVQALAEVAESNKSYELLLNTKADKVDVSAPFNFKGTTTYAKLPTSGNTINDTYYCEDKLCRYTWNGEGWYQSSMNEVDYTDELAHMAKDINDIDSKLSSEIAEIERMNMRMAEYIPESYENKQYTLGVGWSDNPYTYTVKLPISRANEWKATFRVSANGTGLIYVDENEVYKHTTPYPLPTQTTTFEDYTIPYYEDSAFVYVQCFVTSAFPLEKFKIYKDSLINNVEVEKQVIANSEAITTKVDKSNYDASGDFESNFLYADDTFKHQYSDATRIHGCYVPKTLDWKMLSVRVLGDGIGTGAYLDFANKTVGFFTPLSAYSGNTHIVKETEVSVPFDLVTGHPYIVIDDMIATTQTVTFYDAYTLESVTIVKKHTSGRNRCGYGNVTVELGATSGADAYEKKFRKVYMLQPKNPKVMFIGDSYINGYYPHRYATIIKHELKGNAWLEGLSGEASTAILAHFENNLMSIVKPKYIFWAVGTNDTDFNVWLSNTQKFIEDCESIGATPILCTTTITNVTAHNNMAILANEWIRNSGYKYADLNIITTVNYDGATQNTSMFLEDRVHPTNETFALMAKKIMMDVPEIVG